MFTSRRISGDAAAAIGLVDHCVPELELDVFVAQLAAEITRNSAGTNRIDKALIASYGSRTRDEALLFERTLPFGVPDDMRERMAAPAKKKA
jgi:enoyl-CoA hydratase/carnithine racemase